jgi:excisionase family DNA binding protein
MKRRGLGRRWNDLSHTTGPPLTTTELAALIGMSATFIRKEIGNGYLRAIRIGRGRKPVFRIAVGEARRYVRELGLL